MFQITKDSNFIIIVTLQGCQSPFKTAVFIPSKGTLNSTPTKVGIEKKNEFKSL